MGQIVDKKQAERLWTFDFVIISLISLFTFLGFHILLPTLPVYTKNLGGDDTSAGLVIGIFTFSAVLIRPLVGYALDLYGRKNLFIMGMIIFVLCVLAYIWVPSLLILFLIRFIHGFGWGITSTSSSTVATDHIPKSRLGEGMGYYGLASTLATAVAPAIGIYIINSFSFTALFLFAASMIVIAIFMAFLITYPTLNQMKPSFKFLEKAALPSALVIFFVTMTYGTIVSFIALYAAERGIVNIGSFFTLYAVFLAIFRPLSGRLADKRGFNFVIIPSIILIALAMILIYLASSIGWFLLAAIVYGAGFGTAQPCLQALAVLAVPAQRRGSANATFFTGFDLGIGLSSVLWGAVAKSSGYSIMYLWATVPAIVALIVYCYCYYRQ
jgi:MFS family permease